MPILSFHEGRQDKFINNNHFHYIDRYNNINFHSEKLLQISNLLKVLSKKYNIFVFMLIHEGINSESNVAKRMKISIKEYYSRLKQLVDASLISELRGKYIHALLRAIIYKNHITSYGEQLDNLKYMKMTDLLKGFKEYTEKNKKEDSNQINNGLNFNWYGNIQIKIGKVEFGIIHDDNEIGIEIITKSENDKFIGLIFVKDKDVSENLIHYYNLLENSQKFQLTKEITARKYRRYIYNR